jgi:hypothetical protein
VTRYTHSSGGKTWRLYGCAKRGCDAVNPDYLAFGTRDGRTWCLDHRPLLSRVLVWWQERRDL